MPQAHNDPVEPDTDDGDEALDDNDDEETTRFLCVALDDVTFYETAELDAIALLDDTWDSDLDPEVSVQQEQVSAQVCLSFANEKGISKGKARVRADVLFDRHISRWRIVDVDWENWERKLNVVVGDDSTVSFQSSESDRSVLCSRRLQRWSRYIRVYDWQNVPLSVEAVNKTSLTPTPSVAVDIKKVGIFDVHVMDDNDESWLSETDHRTDWNNEFKSGTHREMLYGIVLWDNQKQVVSLVKTKSVSANIREFFSWTHSHYRNDVTASTVERKYRESTSVGPCPDGCTDFSRKGSNARFIRMTCKFYGVVRNEERHPSRQGPASCSHRHTDHKGSNVHTRKTYCVDCGTYTDSVPREIYDVLEATRSASSIRDEALAHRALKDTTITKRQLDRATSLMLE